MCCTSLKNRFHALAWLADLRGLMRLGAGLLATVLFLSGCAGVPSADLWPQPPLHNSADAAGSRWRHHTFPNKKPNAYEPVRLDGRLAMAVRSEAGTSLLRRELNLPAEQLGTLSFSWKTQALIADADLALREKDDSPVRLVLAFDGDRSKLSTRDHMMSEMVRTITGEEMPYATLMYVWCNACPVGSVVPNPRSSRIRKLALESGPANLGRWLDYERDIRLDYQLVFGEEPGRLLSVGVMTDTDNTKSTAQAWYGRVRVVPAAGK